MDTLLYISLPLIFILLKITTQHILHNLGKLPPAPFPSLPLVGHLHLLRKPFHKSLSAISRRHGPLLSLRFGSRPVLLVSSPSLAEQCLSTHDITFAGRPSLLNGRHFGYDHTSLPWAPYGAHWRHLRRISSLHLLSSRTLQSLSRTRAREVRFLLRNLFRLSEEHAGRAVDVKRAAFDFTFNVMTGMVLGRRYFGEEAEGSRESEVFREILSETVRVVPDAQVVDFLPWMRWFGYGEVEREMMRVQENRDRFMQSVLQEIRFGLESSDGVGDGDGEKRNIAEVLLDLQKDEPEYYTDEMIRNLLLVLLQAGSDTTANTLEWAFSLLLENPGPLTKARLEIENLVGPNRLVNESDIDQLPYLQCIINETLRLHPPGPLLLPHQSSSDCTVGGFRVPTGTILLVNVWDIHHNSEVWEDAKKFKPERFRGFDTAKNGCVFLPFGVGRRACPGENLAMRVLAIALGSLIQCFDWEKATEIDMNEGTGFIAPKVQPLSAKCSPRVEIVKLIC